MLMLAFQKHNTTAAYRLASGIDPAAKGAKLVAVPRDFIIKIQKAFLDSLYAFLDGLVHLASEEIPPEAAAAMLSSDGVALRRQLDLSNPVRTFIPRRCQGSWPTSLQKQ